MREEKITILSMGGGQDSTAILYKIIHDPTFREKYVEGELIVIMSDTLDEHEETYEHVEYLLELCSFYNIKFKIINPDEGYHSGDWAGGLIGFYEADDRIGSKCFPKTCTDKLKIQPIYKWVDEYIHLNYGFGKKNKKGKLNKTAIKEYAEKLGKINVMIGIARDEEKRASGNEDAPQVWMRSSVNKVYPLLDEGMNRQDCQDYIKEMELPLPIPSNCVLCPFMSLQELLYLYRVKPDRYHQWVRLERNKLERFGLKDNITKTHNRNGEVVDNMGVWGKKYLPEALELAKEKHGHMTIEDLREYKMSHGHCTMSKY